MAVKLRFDRRYKRFVPKDVRRLGEERGIPKPNRYVPSAQGVSLSRLGGRLSNED